MQANVYEEFDYPDVQEPDPAECEPPRDVVAFCQLFDTMVCGLCDNKIKPREVIWTTDDEEMLFNVAHPVCWAAEIADENDPYRYYGISQRDF
jgi:hypothetical protein